jgi:hypothetical protein
MPSTCTLSIVHVQSANHKPWGASSREEKDALQYLDGYLPFCEPSWRLLFTCCRSVGMKRKQHIRRQRQEKLEELAGVVKAKKPKRGPK